MPSEEVWDAMGYSELVGGSVRRHHPYAAPCPVTVAPPEPVARSIPLAAGEGGAALPWEDRRATLDGAPAMEQVTTAHGRYYLEGGARRPSITTVLNLMEDRSGLDAWRKKVGEEEADRIRARASRIGDAVHQNASEYCATGSWPPETGAGEEDESIRAHTSRIARAIRAHMGALYASELPICSPTLGAAGTVDLVCEWDGKLAIVDYKTKGKPIHPNALDRYYLQCAFYAYCWKELFGHTPNRLVVVESVTDSANAVVHADTLFPHRIRPLSGEVPSFMRALARAKEECKKW